VLLLGRGRTGETVVILLDDVAKHVGEAVAAIKRAFTRPGG
jgi:hypothetical protein